MSVNPTIIEEFMLKQIKEGNIQHYLTDLLLDMKYIREYGEGEYFWGIRGNGCGTDIVCCKNLKQGLDEYLLTHDRVPSGERKYYFDYPLAWAWALAKEQQEVAFATVYRLTVKGVDDRLEAHEGSVELINKATVRNWLTLLEENAGYV